MTEPPEEQPETAPAPAEPQPLLRVLDPNTTPEEIAALVAVFSALGSAPASTPRRPRSLWAAPRPVSAPHHGAGAWRASGLPR